MSRIIALGVALAVAFSVTPPRAAEMLPPQVLDLNVDDVWRPGLGNYATEFQFLGLAESRHCRILERSCAGDPLGWRGDGDAQYRRGVFRAAHQPRSRAFARFRLGRHLFRRIWQIAPASLDEADGLGPTFNRVSCSGCHLKDGRGRPPASPDEPMKSMLVRLSVPGSPPTAGRRASGLRRPASGQRDSRGSQGRAGDHQLPRDRRHFRRR